MKQFRFFSLLLLVLAVLSAAPGFAQDQKAPPASPAATATGKIGKATVTVAYSSPSVKGRPVWGQLVPYNEVWRAGANEATTFTTDQPLQVEGKTLPAGTYSLFAIPTEKEWTVIFNKTAKQWGAYKYDAKQDALRVSVTPKKAAAPTEKLLYDVTPKGLVLRWENLEIPVAIK
ncbi:DUF2911 domain-containing protein [Hymenobacter sp. NST-14]|uniref:DUF2911 domain-containing protein n=1 Tax=Hymenobacter piscis TaxID=2839984 RepID=UPI001C0318D4|nr:DUF2911 domain-containing protein [Hymenobacter piscis]MBT9392637.1 DUF2911 domain-containing protein [Hymenobacter piscis]